MLVSKCAEKNIRSERPQLSNFALSSSHISETVSQIVSSKSQILNSEVFRLWILLFLTQRIPTIYHNLT